jgi:hypothetical protein
MGGRCLGTRSHAAAAGGGVGAWTLGASRMGGRALGASGGRWSWRGLGTRALEGGGLGTRALERGTRGQGVDPGPPWASGWVDTWPLAVKLVARQRGQSLSIEAGSECPTLLAGCLGHRPNKASGLRVGHLALD